MQMQDTVIKYTQILSQILHIDVEIIDENFTRVAGTGLFFDKINDDMMEESHIYKKVFEIKDKIIIENPKENKLCKECKSRDNCKEKYQASVPIILNTEIIGVIGLICFTDEQKKHILDNFDKFIIFLEQIADMIAAKALEEIERDKTLALVDMFDELFDKIDQGIIFINNTGTIKKINDTGRKLLNLSNEDIGKSIEILKIKEFMSKNEYKITINNESTNIIGVHYNIYDGNQMISIYIFEDKNLLKEKTRILNRLEERKGINNIIGSDKKMFEIKAKIKKIANSISTIMITGESGTGKELVAKAVHEESIRKNKPFVAINCAAIPENLLESELFGYVKGAFTGANTNGKKGLIEAADKGTLFLDEIGDMPLNLQAKLLRVIEYKKIYRLGSSTPNDVDVRIVAATNKDLKEYVSNKKFREDLYYRLNVIPIEIPSLKDRKADIKMLAMHFIDKYSKTLHKKVIKVENDVWDYFYRYSWPGNVRELQNTIEYIINMLDEIGIINTEYLPLRIIDTFDKSNDSDLNLDRLEAKTIKKAIDTYGTDLEGKQNACESLGISISTLYRKLKKYNME